MTGACYVWVLIGNHAQAALSGLSNCQHCDSLQLKALRSRLATFTKGLASNSHQSVSAVAEAPHETIAWGDAYESEHMESEMTEYSPFLTLLPGHVQELEERYVEPVVFVNDDLQPPWRPVIRFPSVVSCMMMMCCPPWPLIQRI